MSRIAGARHVARLESHAVPTRLTGNARFASVISGPSRSHGSVSPSLITAETESTVTSVDTFVP